MASLNGETLMSDMTVCGSGGALPAQAAAAPKPRKDPKPCKEPKTGQQPRTRKEPQFTRKGRPYTQTRWRRPRWQPGDPIAELMMLPTSPSSWSTRCNGLNSLRSLDRLIAQGVVPAVRIEGIHHHPHARGAEKSARASGQDQAGQAFAQTTATHSQTEGRLNEPPALGGAGGESSRGSLRNHEDLRSMRLPAGPAKGPLLEEPIMIHDPERASCPESARSPGPVCQPPDDA